MSESSAGSVYTTSAIWDQTEARDYVGDCRLCGEVAFNGAPFLLCARCILSVGTYFCDARAAASDRNAAALNALDDFESMVDYAAEKAARQQASARVYYIRRADRIKIGTTINLALRMTELRPDEILAVEPGSYALEQQRHTEFAAIRVTPRGEWFYDDPVLRSHIAAVVAKHGAPPEVPIFT